MNATPKLLSATATVDERAILPLPNSRKIYIEGSRPDIQVAMREISQSESYSRKWCTAGIVKRG